jgi:hypothetical protein
MALRIRKDGKILCAAMHPRQRGDTYIDDGLHYQMSVVHKVIWTDDNHLDSKNKKGHGEWWWNENNIEYEQLI